MTAEFRPYKSADLRDGEVRMIRAFQSPLGEKLVKPAWKNSGPVGEISKFIPNDDKGKPQGQLKQHPHQRIILRSCTRHPIQLQPMAQAKGGGIEWHPLFLSGIGTQDWENPS